MTNEPIEQWRIEFLTLRYALPSYKESEQEIMWKGFLLAKRSAPVPVGWQLVPKLLTPAMHTAIVHSAGDQTYISWPANCWENALEVAPAYEHK